MQALPANGERAASFPESTCSRFTPCCSFTSKTDAITVISHVCQHICRVSISVRVCHKLNSVIVIIEAVIGVPVFVVVVFPAAIVVCAELVEIMPNEAVIFFCANSVCCLYQNNCCRCRRSYTCRFRRCGCCFHRCPH